MDSPSRSISTRCPAPPPSLSWTTPTGACSTCARRGRGEGPVCLSDVSIRSGKIGGQSPQPLVGGVERLIFKHVPPSVAPAGLCHVSRDQGFAWCGGRRYLSHQTLQQLSLVNA